jgi:hypothetical protein
MLRWSCLALFLVQLVDAKELTPLQELIDSMMGQDKQKLMQGSGGASAQPAAASAAAAAAASPVAADDDACVVKNN